MFKDVAPIITRWGTWLNAVNYYYDNFETFKCYKKFGGDESVCVQIAQECFKNINIPGDLVYIKTNFQLLAI